MTDPEELFRLLDTLDESDESIVTSVRQPAGMRQAVKLAVALGMAANPNDATVQAIRDRLETFAQQLALDEHFERHPQAKPSLAELAIAAADLDAHPLAGEDDLIRTAADEVAAFRPEATSDDVLIYATALKSPSRAAV